MADIKVSLFYTSLSHYLSLNLAIHAMLADTGNLHKLNNHQSSEKCQECGSNKAESTGWVCVDLTFQNS
jgi:hypothetical protein